ncbi:lipopolysaccharide biosynthesis protein [Bacteroidia bacterium]|nr:lipopolysaccharide biosynthesis protein [Bacteroidia bacterium]GHT60723.1 lipopolysaccharide biosynthesis protein [Bacteroidia bacterium]
MTETTLKQKTAKGLLWGSISSSMQLIISLACGIVFARVLSQEDYGLTAVLSVFIAVSGVLIESGFTTGLINRKKIEYADYNAVFWVSLLLGLSIYLILFLAAPLIAAFFDDNRLIILSRIMFLWIISSSLSIAPGALMQKELKIKSRAIVSVCSIFTSSIIGIIIVLLGYGYWGIVVQLVSQSIVSAILLWCFSSWHPNFSFDFQPIKEIFPFSIKMLLTGLITQINANILTVFLGRLFTKNELGTYTQGNKWSGLTTTFVSGIIQGVAQPVFVEAGNNPERQANVFRKMLRFCSFISFPLLFGLAFISPELIPILITDKWLDSILIMQLTCIWGAFSVIGNLYTQLVISHGKSNIYFWNTIILGITQIILLLCIHSWGITRMLIGFLFINFSWLIIWHYYANKFIRLRFRDVMKDIMPYLLITCIAIGCSYFISLYIENIYIRCIQKIVTTAAMYLLVTWQMNSVIFKESIDYILKKTK